MSLPSEEILSTSEELIRTSGLTVTFKTSRGELVACDQIDLTVRKGTSVGIVGESGSGKSTLIRAVQMLVRPTAGEVFLGGVNVTRMSEKALRAHRSKLQFVAQDPYGSLLPNYTVGENIMEPLAIHRVGDRRSNAERALALMERVGLSPGHFHSYPHELSGGQQQRVAVAQALALLPEVLILDEAVSSLDVSIQAQILNLLQKLKVEMGLTYLFISHNLAVIRLMCERTVVMYLGRIVEYGQSDELFANPLHPYTRTLISAIPAFTVDGVTPLDESQLAQGERPSPTNVPKGCAYHTRCPFVRDKCVAERPVLRQIGDQTVACHFAEEFM
ncbi:ABC transporter ATP-binding protein [Alicyclobacillus dauci]|uniref:ATP-binding cassette domain-containing protein n=1 Tax=Alicyclobacillus dauci TaxID=1475485 RepID=A0ABY6YY82_9BACL|nr:oligopeptide/dipeptide ABC transporter ATP-binding protein [Alicyclobacillus dauci]WAH35577.1 ATP-binding cassette domain-containing protein [Alicyclobacillus dauci]